MSSAAVGAASLTFVCERELGTDPTLESFLSIGIPVFSPDLQRLAILVRRTRVTPSSFAGVTTEKNLRAQVVIDGVASEAFNFAEKPAFSPDGAHVAYIAGNGEVLAALDRVVDARLGVVWLVRDGVKGDDYADVGSFVYSPDSKHLAYVAAAMPGQYQLFVDGEPIATTVLGPTPVFDETGNKLAAVIVEPEGQSVLVLEAKDGRFEPLHSSAAHEAVMDIGFVSDDGALAYRASDNGRQLVIVRDAIGPPYRGIRELMFTRDHDHFAYIALLNDDQAAVIVDHRELARADRIEALTLSEQGTHVAYYAVRGEDLVAERDGVALHEPVTRRWGQFNRGSAEFLGSRQIAFSPDGQRVAFVQPVSARREVVNIDGELGQPWRRVTSSVQFSDDGAHVVYWARSKESLVMTTSVLVRDDVVIDSHKFGADFTEIFLLNSEDVLAWQRDGRTKTYSVAINGQAGPVSFERAGPIHVHTPVSIRAAGRRGDRYYSAVLSLDGQEPSLDCESE